MKKQITAREAYRKWVEMKAKPRRAQIINECPDCLGTGKQNRKDCPTCGNEPDNLEGLCKVGGYWYRAKIA